MSDSITDHIENKLRGAIVHGLLAVLAMLVRPIATLTEVFFRKDIGERYLTPSCVIGGLLLIGIFCTPYGHMIGSMVQSGGHEFFGGPSNENTWSGHDAIFMVILLAWSAALAFLYQLHELEIRQRYQKGLRWHSVNCGIPRIPTLPYPVEKSIPIGIGFIVAFGGLYGPCLLLILSGLVSILLRAYEAQQFRGRMLDVIDGQIEQENLAKAVKGRLSPTLVEGLQTPLAAYVSNKFREHFVKSISPAPATAISTAPEETADTTTAPMPTAG